MTNLSVLWLRISFPSGQRLSVEANQGSILGSKLFVLVIEDMHFHNITGVRDKLYEDDLKFSINSISIN